MSDRMRTLNWSSAVAGVLSVHSKKIFKSGQMTFNEPGWWSLQKLTRPKQLSLALIPVIIQSKLEANLEEINSKGMRKN